MPYFENFAFSLDEHVCNEINGQIGFGKSVSL